MKTGAESVRNGNVFVCGVIGILVVSRPHDSLLQITQDKEAQAARERWGEKETEREEGRQIDFLYSILILQAHKRLASWHSLLQIIKLP